MGWYDFLKVIGLVVTIIGGPVTLILKSFTDKQKEQKDDIKRLNDSVQQLALSHETLKGDKVSREEMSIALAEMKDDIKNHFNSAFLDLRTDRENERKEYREDVKEFKEGLKEVEAELRRRLND